MNLAALLVLIVPVQMAFAATGSTPAPDKPVVTFTEGQPVTAVWSNGDAAELRFNRSTTLTIPIPFQVTENLCKPGAGQIFTLQAALRADRLGWFWTKNTVPENVGTPVTPNFAGMKVPLVRFSLINNGTQFSFPDLVRDLPKDALDFQDLSWLPESKNGEFNIDSWMSEAMSFNSQTGLTENRIVAGANNVHVALNNLQGVIDNMASGFVLPSSTDTPLVGDVVSWIIRGPNGPCQITFKPNLGQAQSAVLKFITTLPLPTTTYLWHQDSLTKTLESQFFAEELWYDVH